MLQINVLPILFHALSQFNACLAHFDSPTMLAIFQLVEYSR